MSHRRQHSERNAAYLCSVSPRLPKTASTQLSAFE